MADGHSLTLRAALDKVMSEEHADVVREGVAAFVAELMEAEVAGQIGAQLHEKAPGRVTHRNGYRPREWETRAGTIELEIPRLRSGSYFPSFLEPRTRAEQALVAVVQEAYVNGVLNRRGKSGGSATRRAASGQGRIRSHGQTEEVSGRVAGAGRAGGARIG